MKIITQKIKYDSYKEFINHREKMKGDGFEYSKVLQNLSTGEIMVTYKLTK